MIIPSHAASWRLEFLQTQEQHQRDMEMWRTEGVVPGKPTEEQENFLASGLAEKIVVEHFDRQEQANYFIWLK